VRSKTLSVVFSVMLAASLFLDCEAHARAGSSGGGGSRGSSSSGSRSSSPPSSPSGSYGNSASKPGSSPSSPSSPSQGGSGYGNSATKPSSSGAPSEGSSSKGGYGNSATPASGGGSTDPSKSSSSGSPVQNKMNRSFSKQESAKAYEAYTAQQAKFQKGTSASSYNPAGREQTTINSVRSRASYSSTDYYARRTVFYDTYRWQPPVYIYRSYSSFGIWDGMMLWFMLDHINDRQYAEMYYHHRDDPGMQQFRTELDRLSAENAELKNKVKQLDESSKSLEQQGVKVDPAYVPPDAAGVVLAANFADKASPKESSGFPWGWAAGIGVLGLLGFLLTRRKK
jgi:hypothetical protein